MAEKVEIIVDQKSTGSALKDAALDAEKLKQLGSYAPQYAAAKSDQEREFYVQAAARTAKLDAERRAAQTGTGKADPAITQSVKALEEQVAAEAKAAQSAQNAVLAKKQQAQTQAELAKAVKKQADEEAAIAKAAEAQRARLTNTALHGAMQAAAGGSPVGALSSLASAGGVGAMAGAAIVSAVATGISMYFEEKKKDALSADRTNSRAHADDRTLEKLRRGDNAEGSLTASHETEYEMRAAQDRAQEIRDRTQRSWYNPLGWFGNSQTWDGQRESKENEDEVEALRRRSLKERRVGIEQYKTTGGGAELQIQEQLYQGKTKEALAAKDQLTYEKERLRVRELLRGAPDADARANEAAGMKVALEQRERSQHFARSISARSGAGDIAMAAAAASGGLTSGTNGVYDLVGAIHGLHQTVRDQAKLATREPWKRTNTVLDRH